MKRVDRRRCSFFPCGSTVCLLAYIRTSLTPASCCVWLWVCVSLSLCVRVHGKPSPISSALSAGPFEPDQKQHNWAWTLKCSFQELAEGRKKRIDHQRGRQTAVLLCTSICQLLQLLHNLSFPPSCLFMPSFSVCSLSWKQEEALRWHCCLYSARRWKHNQL